MQEVLTAEDEAGWSPRAATARFVLSPPVQSAIMALIVLNAVILGLETAPSVMNRWGEWLIALDFVLLCVFTVEIAVRIFAFRGRFFRDPWGVFDLLVITIAWLPATGPLAVLRALRVLRVLRLISMMPRLRIVVEAMLHAIPGIGAIAMLLLILYYVAAVIATKLFGGTHPELFGTIGGSMFTLFQVMTLESWSTGVARPVMEDHPQAWAFFVPFVLVATFVVLNLFIGIIVESIQTLRKTREQADQVRLEAQTAMRAELHSDALTILQQVRALREEVAGLRAALAAARR